MMKSAAYLAALYLALVSIDRAHAYEIKISAPTEAEAVSRCERLLGKGATLKDFTVSVRPRPGKIAGKTVSVGEGICSEPSLTKEEAAEKISLALSDSDVGGLAIGFLKSMKVINPAIVKNTYRSLKESDATDSVNEMMAFLAGGKDLTGTVSLLRKDVFAHDDEVRFKVTYTLFLIASKSKSDPSIAPLFVVAPKDDSNGLSLVDLLAKRYDLENPGVDNDLPLAIKMNVARIVAQLGKKCPPVPNLLKSMAKDKNNQDIASKIVDPGFNGGGVFGDTLAKALEAVRDKAKEAR
jgi:hypothetical protein